MAVRRRPSTIKKTLKVPPSISAPDTSYVEPSTETLTTETQMPESQPFEVKVEVETSPQEPTAQPVTQPTEEVVSEQSSLRQESSPEVKTEEAPPENTVPDNLYIQQESKRPGSGKKWFFILIGILVLLFVAFGIYTYSKAMKGLNAPSPTPAPQESSPAPTPTSSPSAQLNRGDLKVQVLNGTSVIGLAARARAYLEGLGYKSVATGNADDNNLTETTIAIKDTKKDYLELLKTDVGPKYPLAKSSKILNSSSPYDAVVTLGQP